MQQAIKRVADGDIAGAMAWQLRANQCLGHGIRAVDMPEEYFQLMYQGILAARAGDMAKLGRVRTRMQEVLQESIAPEA